MSKLNGPLFGHNYKDGKIMNDTKHTGLWHTEPTDEGGAFLLSDPRNRLVGKIYEARDAVNVTMLLNRIPNEPNAPLVEALKNVLRSTSFPEALRFAAQAMADLED